MDMPGIIECTADECAYNRDHQCHALAITIGDGEHPRCDTFVDGSEKGGDGSATGRVGACKVAGCEYNESLECQASGIVVGEHRPSDYDCMTYEPR